jgi:hypothetical protein
VAFDEGALGGCPGNQNDGVECLFDRLLLAIDEKTMAIIETKAETLAKARVRNVGVPLFAMVLPRVIQVSRISQKRAQHALKRPAD